MHECYLLECSYIVFILSLEHMLSGLSGVGALGLYHPRAAAGIFHLSI